MKPRLILAVVVDQFRYDYLTRFRGDYHGGVARLLEHGAEFTDARYIHYPTVTAVGHSTFLSGATPSVSGIIGNAWFDRNEGREVTSVCDGSTPLVGVVAAAEKDDCEAQGSSPRRLLVSTLGDELKIARKASKVIGISLKDRGAILPAGHLADAAYWFDSSTRHFVTSTYYMKKLPSWVAEFNELLPGKVEAYENWRPVDQPDGDPFCTMKPDPMKPKLRICGTVKPAIENTPLANEILLELAQGTIENEKLGNP